MKNRTGTRLKLTVTALGLSAACVIAAAWTPVNSGTSPRAMPQKNQAMTSAFAGPLNTEPRFNRLIIRFKDSATTRAGVFDVHTASNHVAALGTRMQKVNPEGIALRHLKSVTQQTHVALIDKPMSRAELFALARRLEQDPAVSHAEIDELVYPQFVPNDTYYASHQWHYAAPATYAGAANLPLAWDASTGSGVVVAVIDTGYRPHVDLAANILPGYDFVSDIQIANDGDGIDSSPLDPGDWITSAENAAGYFATCPVGDSSWHGTHVAGTIAAVTNNGMGMAGVAYNARILPVRVLGKCGGYTSDIAAGMRWAAGLVVPNVTTNPNKAKILNLSLGGSGACGTTFQDAINDVRAAGSAVVVATGNSGLLSIAAPANCNGVIAVTAHTKLGDNASYSNVGSGTVISAPGGGVGAVVAGDGALVHSTLNAGTTSPGADAYAGYQGTSMAAPHVAGVAALLASLLPSATPDTLKSLMVNSARAHPAGTYCTTYPVNCGAGLLDAKAAIDRLNNLMPTTSATAVPAGVLLTGSTVTLDGQATAAPGGSGFFTYRWSQLSGPAVTIANSTLNNAYFVAPSPGNTYTFLFEATDGTGLTASSQVSVTTDTPPLLASIPAKSVALNGNLSFTVTATDAENNSVVYVATGLPSGSTFNAATGTFTWNNAGPLGSYSFTVTPSDGHFSGTPKTVSISVVTPGSAGSGGGGGGGGGGGALDLWDLVGLLLLLGLSTTAVRHRITTK